MLEYRAVHRVEKGLGNFKIIMALDQPRVDVPGSTPEFKIPQFVTRDQFHIFVDLVGFLLVQINALGRSRAYSLPVGVFKL